MQIALELQNHEVVDELFLTWSPTICQLKNLDGATGTATLRFHNEDTTSGGQVIFSQSPGGPFSDQLDLDVDFGAPLPQVFVAGKFDLASGNLGDAAIEIIDVGSGAPVGRQSAMVRIRKNANGMTVGERDRFLDAFGTLNDQGQGDFRDFRDMHTSQSDRESHRNLGFLPWHRSYLLDLERELQQIDPSVTLPYWRFDQAAPNLFSQDFIGFTSSGSVDVQFSANNPLVLWTTDNGQVGVERMPHFNTSNSPASNPIPGFPLRNEFDTLNLGTVFSSFAVMEGSPHGAAHVSFDGFIDNPHTAAKDPLFFLLHCNVDRLWAKWQWSNLRHDKTNPDTFTNQGSSTSPGSARIGHNSLDTMWPWNQDVSSPRPSTAPGGSFPASNLVPAPGPTPEVWQMIDFQGKLTTVERLGFDYDDVRLD